MRNKLEKTLIVCAISCMLLFALGAVVQPAKAQFVIAYDYDTSKDGNYMAYIIAYVDSVPNGTVYYNPTSYPDNTAIQPLDIQAGVNLTLAVFCWVNGTVTGISSLSEGLAIMRHNTTVICSNGTSVFSQQNFTYIIGTDGGAPMYFFRHDVILDFIPVSGEIYTVTVTYEVFY